MSIITKEYEVGWFAAEALDDNSYKEEYEK